MRTVGFRPPVVPRVAWIARLLAGGGGLAAVPARSLPAQVPAQARGSQPDASDTLHAPASRSKHRWEPGAVGLWTALARDQRLATRFGPTRGRSLSITGLQASWPLAGGRSVALTYTADVLPVVISTGMPDYAPSPLPPSCRTTACPYATEQQVRRTVYGAGLAPIGFEVSVGGARRVSLIGHASAGVVEFARPIPDPAATRLNFTLDGGVALDLRVERRGRVRAGYHRNHISNGGRGSVNPGMNSNMLDIGFALSR